MKPNYYDFIAKFYDYLIEEDSRLLSLPDTAKDEAVEIWLKNHTTWLEDIFPASFGKGVCKIAVQMIFGKTPVRSKLVSDLFIAMANDSPDTYGRDDQWWSHALEVHLDEYVNLDSFVTFLRERIYLYLELHIEEEVFQQMADIAEENTREGLHEL